MGDKSEIAWCPAGQKFARKKNEKQNRRRLNAYKFIRSANQIIRKL